MVKSSNSGMFDWSLYGLLVRKFRTDMGYKNAEDFADTIWRRTRVEVSRTSLYKIEQGKQAPSAEQFMAINMALGGAIDFEEITNLCKSTEWKEILRGDHDPIPLEWRYENYERAIQEHAGNGEGELKDGVSDYAVAKAANDPCHKLFARPCPWA